MRYLVSSENSDDRALSKEILKELVIPLGDFVTDVLQKREGLMYYAHIASLLRSFLNVERVL